MGFLPKFKIAQKLPLALVGSALVVGLGIGTAAYMIGMQTVERQRQQSMQAVVESSIGQVADYFKLVEADLKLFASRADTGTQIENMSRGWAGLNAQGTGTKTLQNDFIANNPNPFARTFGRTVLMKLK